jgi:signal transduction histidine kinase
VYQLESEENMSNFLKEFVSSNHFMPHGHCYFWNPGILWLHILSDALITLAYFSIPFTLVYFVRKRNDLEFRWMFLCFAVFIVACGTTHLMEIWVIWHPAYWLSGTVKAITALASVPTAVLLVKLIPVALRLPSPSTLRQANTKLRALSARIQSVREEEAIRIAREIHDELGQRLTGLKMDLLWAERQLGQPVNPVARNAILDRIVEATELVDGITTTVQEIATALRPVVLDKLGLGSALQHEARRFQERTGLVCKAHLPETEATLAPEIATTLFRIFQECLTNVLRHAHAAKVEVELQVENANVTMRVEDDGCGIPDAELANSESLGLLGMKERVALLGGEIALQRRGQTGTIVTVRIPRNATSASMKGPV